MIYSSILSKGAPVRTVFCHLPSWSHLKKRVLGPVFWTAFLTLEMLCAPLGIRESISVRTEPLLNCNAWAIPAFRASGASCWLSVEHQGSSCFMFHKVDVGSVQVTGKYNLTYDMVCLIAIPEQATVTFPLETYCFHSSNVFFTLTLYNSFWKNSCQTNSFPLSSSEGTLSDIGV